MSVNDGILESNFATMHMHVVIPPPNIAPVLDLDVNNSTTTGANYLTGFTESGRRPVAIVDADVRSSTATDPNLASATITLTNPQAGDASDLRRNAAGRHPGFRLGHKSHHAHGRRVVRQL